MANRSNVEAMSSEKRNLHFDSRFHEMSHDLRTPLNQINGFAELLLMDESLSAVQAGYVRAILSGGETLKEAVLVHLNHAEAIGPAYFTALRAVEPVRNEALVNTLSFHSRLHFGDLAQSIPAGVVGIS